MENRHLHHMNMFHPKHQFIVLVISCCMGAALSHGHELQDLINNQKVAEIVSNPYRDEMLLGSPEWQVWLRAQDEDAGAIIVPNGKSPAAVHVFKESSYLATIPIGAVGGGAGSSSRPQTALLSDNRLLLLSYGLAEFEGRDIVATLRVDVVSDEGVARVMSENIVGYEPKEDGGIIIRDAHLSVLGLGLPTFVTILRHEITPLDDGQDLNTEVEAIFRWNDEDQRFVKQED